MNYFRRVRDRYRWSKHHVKRYEEQLAELIRVIDAKLAKEWYTGRDHLIISVSSVHEKVRRAILSAYAEAGWKVEYKSEQRDGSWFDFKAK